MDTLDRKALSLLMEKGRITWAELGQSLGLSAPAAADRVRKLEEHKIIHGYSALAAFENFTARAISAVQANPALWKSTAIFVTFDESGGYYDSGYIQPVSFFGDGPRVPMLVVSPYARRDYIDHTYTDHVSILKFIEANWRLRQLTSYSEDNLPNPAPDVYVPGNRPAIGNLMTLFDFGHPDFAKIKLTG